MVPMRNDSGDDRRLGRGAKLYEAAPGEVIDVYRIDVAALAARGFVRVADSEEPLEEEAPASATEDLEDMTLDDLTEIARERDLPGRSTMSKGELVAALRDTQE